MWIISMPRVRVRPEDWVVTVNRMLSKSNAPQVSPADNAALVNYLTRYLGDDVNGNKA